ncbi:translocation/assembly module TamB domain-containing protein [Roseomonas sp. PWR1]|uniref:Translocation/assembly module TamB domain-containing protein n=1 Tax=Roseomonas nitratireducens TaxID=2820810 RepID=A0ABS4AQV4_9PROT|nr:translocation/assembly module TamB domain-containing protein [Neoroseomonas nitratireducens]MBP0463228.1 translocation/assembly module TamB domain-containing protein [Neoroseomonas nitratireducens]
MRRALRSIGLTLLALPVLLLVILAGGLVWANGEGGRATIARLAEDAVPGLRIQGLASPLPARLAVGRLTMSDEAGAWVELEDAAIALDLMALLGREVRVTALTARRVALHRLPPGDSTPPPPPDPDAPLVPALPELPVALRLDRLAVERIELGAAVAGIDAVLAVEGEASLASGALAARLALRRLDAPAEARIALDLAPGADRLSARIEAAEPPGGLLATALGLPGRAAALRLSLDGPARGARLDLAASLGDDITLAAGGTVRAAPDGAAGAALTLRLAAAPLLPEALRAAAMPAEVALDGEIDAARRVTLRRFAVQAPAARAEASGGADLAAERLDLALRLSVGESTAFGALIPPVARFAGITAEARASGAMRAPAIALDLAATGFASDTPALAAALGATPRLSLRGALPDRIEALSIDGAGARVTAEGLVGETLDATIRARVADLAPLVPGLAGALAAEARLTGPRGDPSLALTARGERVARGAEVLEAPDLALNVATPLSAPRAEARLTATYAGLPVALDLAAAPEGERIRLARLAARFGPASLDAAGLADRAAATFQGNATLDVTDLAPFSSLAGMRLAGRVALRAVLDLRDGMQGFDATLDVPEARVDGTALAGRVAARGTLAAAEAEIEARAQDARLTTRARLTQEGDARRVDIAEMLLRRGADSLRLTAPARVTLAADGGIALAGIALTTSRGGTLRAEGTWGPEQADIRATLAALPVAGIAALAAPDLAARGTISAEARITGPVGDPAARFRLEATGLAIADPAFRGLPPARLLVEGTAGARGADLRLDAAAGAVLRANGTARLPGGFAGTAPLAARLEANADLGAIAGPILAAGSQRVAGRLALAMEAGGTLAAPALTGRATLSGGAFRDLAQGVTLSEIEAVLRAEGDRVVIDRFAARTPGNGTIGIGGTLSPLAPGLPAELTLTARGARPLRSDLASGVFDADLRLVGRLLEQARLDGRVEIKRLDITVPEKLPPSVRRIEGVRERGRRPPNTPPLDPPRPAGAPSGLPDIALAIEVAAPRAVFVRGRGIDAEFGGTMNVGGAIAAPAVTGGLSLRRGNISIFDRRLDFRRGTIAFDAGTLVPSLDFLAASRAREVTANVTVTGPATDPRIEFSSTPELPQDEILSRLLFDRRASELSPFQLAQLAQVLAGAAGIETPGAAGILDRIRRTLALDRLAVGEDRRPDGGRGQGATLETGRYVAEGVYVGVRQSSEGGAPRVGVQIDVLPRVRIEAETGGNSAAGDRVGLSFEIEY